jgi:hypothetical protein
MSSKNRMWLTGFCSLASSLQLPPPASPLAQTIAAPVPVGAGPAIAKISRWRNVMRRIYTNLLPIALFLVLVPTAPAATTWYVDGMDGNDSNNCQTAETACKTIGDAIWLAASGNSIIVEAATYAENLTIGLSLKVIGSGASTTIIDGKAAGRVIVISSANAQVTLSNVTIRNGVAVYGGGIYNAGRLTINSSTISGNYALGCLHGWGGGILNYGTATINNSTISGNSASYLGQGGGIWSYSGSQAALQNSIVANNVAGNRSGNVTSYGYNLSSDGTCSFGNSGDLNDHDPRLGPLQNNGGPTQTMALTSGSPAIDAGNPSGCTDGQGQLLKTDQRGQPRPDNEDTGGCDMEAFESQSD